MCDVVRSCYVMAKGDTTDDDFLTGKLLAIVDTACACLSIGFSFSLTLRSIGNLAAERTKKVQFLYVYIQFLQPADWRHFQLVGRHVKG